MSVAISCGEAVRRLWEYLDSALAADDHRELERHLAFCVRCCGELEFARELQRRLRSTVIDVPVDARGRLERFIGALGDGNGGCDG
jgi:anti-sigma factor (TIGR02949 family)